MANDLDFRCSFQHMDLMYEEIAFLTPQKDTTDPDLKFRVERTLACQDASDRQAEAAGLQTPRVKALRELDAAALNALPAACREAAEGDKRFAKSGVIDKLAKANALLNAGLSDEGCALLAGIDSDSEELRQLYVACYKATSGDAKLAGLSEAAVSKAGGVQDMKDKLAAASRQFKCGS